MKSADRTFNMDQRRRISEAVAAAESLTAAEIVPVVATTSSVYHRACDLCGLWVGLLVLFALWLVVPEQSDQLGSFGGWPAAWKALAMMLGVIVGFISGATLAVWIAPLRRMFLTERQLQHAAQQRARQVFFDGRIHHTRHATGILLYISLFEQVAVVLADRAAHEALGDANLQSLCDKLTQGLTGEDLTAALCDAIQTTGQLLAPALPAESVRDNQLTDALVTLE